MKTRTAIFPGSFDPITSGHFDIVQRALPLFDKIIIAIGYNAQKKYLLSLEQRLGLLEELFADEAKIETDSYKGLTANYCSQKKVSFILRGLRSSSDFEYEKAIAQLNSSLDQKLETVFLITSPGFSHISSSIVREILSNGGNAAQFLPEAISEQIHEMIRPVNH